MLQNNPHSKTKITSLEPRLHFPLCGLPTLPTDWGLWALLWQVLLFPQSFLLLLLHSVWANQKREGGREARGGVCREKSGMKGLEQVSNVTPALPKQWTTPPPLFLSLSCSCFWPYKVERTHQSQSKKGLSALIRFVRLCLLQTLYSSVSSLSSPCTGIHAVCGLVFYLLIFSLRSSHFAFVRMWLEQCNRVSTHDTRDSSPAQAKSQSSWRCMTLSIIVQNLSLTSPVKYTNSDKCFCRFINWLKGTVTVNQGLFQY